MAFKDVNFDDVYRSEISRSGLGSARGMDFAGEGLQIIGAEDAVAKLHMFGLQIVKASIVSSKRFADLVLFTSLKHVPFDTGLLWESGRVDRAHDANAHKYVYTVGYYTDYAALVHENPYGKTFHQGVGPYPGEQKIDHWLTYALEVESKAFPDLVRGEIRDHAAEFMATGGASASLSVELSGSGAGGGSFSSWEDVLANWKV